MSDLIKGFDISPLSEIERRGGRFYDSGKEEDALFILKRYGMDLARIRLWNDPYDEEGREYGAGTTDLKTVEKLAERVKKLGISWLLDFHYSDFWADPGKQRLPKAWRSYGPKELEEAVYSYTAEVLRQLKEKDLSPDMVAVGNEVTNGLLWPIGHRDNFEEMVRLLSQGIRAVREVLPSSKVMIHLDNGGNRELYEGWLKRYFELNGEDFDVLGMSFYPFWHGTLDDLYANMENIASLYHKEMIVAETSYVFTDRDYAAYEEGERKGPAAKGKLLEGLRYPASEEGQCAFMEALMEQIASVKDDLGKGFIYWGGLSIPVKGFSWANENALSYIQEKGPGGNEWANQAVFDYDGNVLPVLKTIKQF